jgi:hypothetical protein
MKKLSIIGKDYSTEEGVVGFYNAGDRMKAWGKTGAFWGGLWGMLFGSALFVIPGVGPLFAAGPLVAWIVGALEGAAVGGGMSALGAGLYSVGIPKGRHSDCIRSSPVLIRVLLSVADNNSDYLAGAGFGRSIVNTQPLPGRLRTRSEPPFASTPRRLIPRPRPKPDRSPLRCSNSRNRSSASPGGRPPHSSSTSIKTRAADENVVSETRL